MTYRADWQPIETAPLSEPVIVTDEYHWTLARKVPVPFSTLQFRWPFIVNGESLKWVFSCSGFRLIDFKPSHWARLDLQPPSRINGEETRK